MAKQAAKKPESKKQGNNANRKNDKASKKHPKTNDMVKTGRTVGGYSPARVEMRESIRANPFQGLVKRSGIKVKSKKA